jgi:ABC-type transport system involved in multi-copper enzyme maturation permease subunit
MFVTAKKVFSYLDWLMLIAFIVTFGVLVIPQSTALAIGVLIFALIALYFMIVLSSRRNAPQNRIGAGSPIGYPLTDCVILTFGIMEILDPDEWFPLSIVGCIALIVDLLLWGIIAFESFSMKE